MSRFPDTMANDISVDFPVRATFVAVARNQLATVCRCLGGDAGLVPRRRQPAVVSLPALDH